MPTFKSSATTLRTDVTGIQCRHSRSPQIPNTSVKLNCTDPGLIIYSNILSLLMQGLSISGLFHWMAKLQQRALHEIKAIGGKELTIDACVCYRIKATLSCKTGCNIWVRLIHYETNWEKEDRMLQPCTTYLNIADIHFSKRQCPKKNMPTYISASDAPAPRASPIWTLSVWQTIYVILTLFDPESMMLSSFAN